LGVDATLVRVGFLLISFLGGAGLLLYPALWMVIPTESRLDSTPSEVVREGWQEIRGRVNRGGRGSRRRP
jgi:PspC domain.